ncbi:MAG: DNA polymerase III subunit alpha [Verrucomicrobia bacterium ADurb.Bin345]|nr:MAG: DNA polymerase III subunit alpha [Verrucomicrobia bacterium ADurb.Bin345]
MAKNVPFTHLHFHTEYSLLDGACQVDRTMTTAQELGMSAVAVTDHGSLYGVVDFYKQAKSAGIKPILGCEVYVASGRMQDRKTESGKSYANHLVLLAQNETGYRNLVKMVSLAHLEGFYYKPRIDKELLSGHAKGLIALSSCLKGEVTSAAAQGQVDAAVKAAGVYADIMGPGNFYLELQDHGIAEQRTANRHLLEVARKLKLPIVATNDVHYLKPEHAEAHEVLLCLQTQTVMTDPKRMRYQSDQFYMKSGEQMLALFPDHPEALSNTMDIADRCNVDLHLEKELHFPQYEVPAGTDQKTYLWKLTREGLARRYGIANFDRPANDTERLICERAEFELKVIEQTGFINYFLVVWDFIRFAHEQQIPVGPGRGSGAGSIVAYALGITGIDPLRYNLIFERFLNPERVSPPDFDIDFCQNRRGEVIEYVRQKYGRDNVAQIITFGTLGAKTVIRDIGRVLEIPLKECDLLAKMIPEDPGMTLENALKQSPEFHKACDSNPNAKRIMKYAPVLEGLPRNPGTHAAGVVIGEKPLIEIIPLTRDKNGETITQFEMKPIGQIGLLKMDFLGLKTLTVIQEAVDNVRMTQQVTLDMSGLPMDDAATFDLLNRGDTVGVFQVESKGMRDLLRRIGLTRFEDLIAMIALFRPGPMNMLENYVNRKHGKVQIVNDHPLLEPVLKETYGVMLYQEQVQQAANVLAGFSLGQGDLLRRAMGKKDPKEMARMRDTFVQGCLKTNRIPKPKAEKIFDNIERFAGYGFNKSHSAAYAILSYQTAYLKAHYPVEFMAALLTSEIGNFDKLPVLVAEAREMGVEVLPPNVNDSVVRFKPEGKGIRYGLAGVKTIGAGAVEALVKEREANGPYAGFVDFCCRVDSQMVNRKTLEGLIKCGAFDFTHLSRGRLFNGMDTVLSHASGRQRDRQSGQANLFDVLAPETNQNSDDMLPPADPWPESTMLSEERNLIGFYISGHPLTAHEWALKTFCLADARGLENMAAGSLTRIGGLVSQMEKRLTKKTQEPWATFRLEDLNASVNVMVFPEAFRDYGVFLQNEAPVMVCGELAKEEQQIRIKAAEIYPLKDVHRFFADRVSIHVPAVGIEDEKLRHIREILARHPGETAVTLCLVFPSGEKVFVNADRTFKVAATEAFVRDIEHAVGEGSVYIGVDKRPCRRSNGGRNGKPWNRSRQEG